MSWRWRLQAKNIVVLEDAVMGCPASQGWKSSKTQTMKALPEDREGASDKLRRKKTPDGPKKS